MNFFQSLKSKAVDYISLKFEILRLELVERIVNVIGYLIFTIILLFLVFAVVLFLSYGLAEFFSSVFENRTLGYFATAGVILVLTGIVLWQSKNIIKFFANKIVGLVTKPTSAEEALDEDNNNITKL